MFDYQKIYSDIEYLISEKKCDYIYVDENQNSFGSASLSLHTDWCRYSLLGGHNATDEERQKQVDEYNKEYNGSYTIKDIVEGCMYSDIIINIHESLLSYQYQFDEMSLDLYNKYGGSDKFDLMSIEVWHNEKADLEIDEEVKKSFYKPQKRD